jgi:hypothetical protein
MRCWSSASSAVYEWEECTAASRLLGIAAALGDIGAQKGLGIVLDFLRHGVVGLAAEFGDGMRRAGVGSGAMAAMSAAPEIEAG